MCHDYTQFIIKFTGRCGSVVVVLIPGLSAGRFKEIFMCQVSP
jgi:hypothetical protein